MRSPSRPTTVTRRTSIVLAAVALAGLAGCGGTGAPGSPAAAPVAASPTTTPPVDVVPDPTPTTTAPETATTPQNADPVPAPAGAAPAVAAGLRPASISIPAIGVTSVLTDLGINKDGSIEVPTNPAQAGWLDRSPAPGQQGPAVIAGHVDSKTGPAVFYHLSQLKVGDPIVVTRHDGSKVTFTVDGVQTYLKSQFPTEATYGPVPGPALRLITCGGSYVKSEGGYQANVVVFAS